MTDRIPNEELAQVIAQLGDDEQAVLMVLALRLLEGQERYGRLNVVADLRDFLRERRWEIEDLLVYTAFEALRTELQRGEKEHG